MCGEPGSVVAEIASNKETPIFFMMSCPPLRSISITYEHKGLLFTENAGVAHRLVIPAAPALNYGRKGTDSVTANSQVRRTGNVQASHRAQALRKRSRGGIGGVLARQARPIGG